jgi:cytochrome c oxidase cbb3-type subunit III
MSTKAPRNQVLGHADEADGIEEYDNPLPDWWLGLFWLTIIFAVGYTLHYHWLADRSQVKELAAEMAAAETRWPAQAAPAALVVTEELAEEGAAVFATNCVGCHGKSAEGGIGPNLKDATWIHGGAPEQILATVTNGVAAKGMPGWGPILGPEKTRQVAAYVASLTASD